MFKQPQKKQKGSVAVFRNVFAVTLFCAAVCIFGCDRKTRHDVLTFFFEGVPPLDGNKEDNSVYVIENNGSDKKPIDKSQTPETREKTVLAQQTNPSRHKPVRDCAKCHSGSLGSGRRKLRKSLPGLCYSCHPDYSKKELFLHGPLNKGECVFCHEPHQSKYVHLQKAPEPQLCYKCHTRKEISNINDHEELLDGICSKCHDPHASSLPHMLKADLIQHPDSDPNSTDPEMQAETETHR